MGVLRSRSRTRLHPPIRKRRQVGQTPVVAVHRTPKRNPEVARRQDGHGLKVAVARARNARNRKNVPSARSGTNVRREPNARNGKNVRRKPNVPKGKNVRRKPNVPNGTNVRKEPNVQNGPIQHPNRRLLQRPHPPQNPHQKPTAIRQQSSRHSDGVADVAEVGEEVAGVAADRARATVDLPTPEPCA